MLKRPGLLLFLLLLVVSKLCSQTTPKLVVGIVVDQMRADYLHRFSKAFCDSGFNRLLQDGYVCQNAHLNYIPTFTGPGHASIYCGSTPSVHGIVSNDWYDKKEAKDVYCTEDGKCKFVGGLVNKSGMSPNALLAPTITDVLSKTSPESKIIGVSLKDRAAILPAGKLGDAAYWLSAETGMISSDYYFPHLPAWVIKFNEEHPPHAYLNKDWDLLLPNEFYEGIPDIQPYEEAFKTEEMPVFPHQISMIKEKEGAGILKKIPFGNTYTLDFATEVIKHEQLGYDTTTDFLCISLSSTDYIGHQFGPGSLEIFDTYARLDRDLALFIAFLEQTAGLENVLIFLTSDHGVLEQKQNTDSCFYNVRRTAKDLNKLLKPKWGDSLIYHVVDEELYLNPHIHDTSVFNITLEINNHMTSSQWLLEAVAPNFIGKSNLTNMQKEMIGNGYLHERSGDIWLIPKPGCLPADYMKGGTTHSTFYDYDTHVPLIFHGNGILPFTNTETVNITDIAPTIAYQLKLPTPMGCTGKTLKIK